MNHRGRRITRSALFAGLLVTGPWGLARAGTIPPDSVASRAAPEASVASPVAAKTRSKPPLTQVLGVKIGMKEDEVHRRLGKLGERQERKGEREEGEETGRELWNLRHPRFRYVLVTFDDDHRVKLVQGYMRPGGPRMRYGEIGSLSEARRLGFYIYEWQVPASGDRPALLVQARGDDPIFLGNYMVLRNPRVGSGEPPAPVRE